VEWSEVVYVGSEHLKMWGRREESKGLKYGLPRATMTSEPLDVKLTLMETTNISLMVRFPPKVYGEEVLMIWMLPVRTSGVLVGMTVVVMVRVLSVMMVVVGVMVGMTAVVIVRVFSVMIVVVGVMVAVVDGTVLKKSVPLIDRGRVSWMVMFGA
jgi:hypothetical protein